MAEKTVLIKNPEMVLKMAFGFVRGAKALAEASLSKPDSALLWPQLTVDLLHIELMFKALISLEGNGEVPKTHRFLVLFDKLSAKSKEAMEASFIKGFDENPNVQRHRAEYAQSPAIADRPPYPETLHDVLTDLNDSFQQVRYAFEGVVPRFMFLSHVAMALLDTFRAAEPEMVERCLKDRSAGVTHVYGHQG
jgi:hypothetical protein